MSPSDARVTRIAGLFDAVADTYDAVGVDFFGPIAAGLVDALAPRPGERVLDVGCGRGAVLLRMARAVGPGGAAVGIDVSAGMVDRSREAIASAGLANATAFAADAQDPVVDEGPFDLLASSLVLFFLPDPGLALQRWRDLVRPGGRIGVTTFAGIDPRWAEVDEVFAPYLPPDLRDARTTGAAGPFASDAGMEELLLAAGFTGVTTVPAAVDVCFDSAEAWHAFSLSTGQRAMWQSVPAEQRPEVRAAAERRLRAHAAPDGSVTFVQPVRHTLGVRPGP